MGAFQSKKSYQVEKEEKRKGVVEQRIRTSDSRKDARNTLQMKEEVKQNIIEAEKRSAATTSNDIEIDLINSEKNNQENKEKEETDINNHIEGQTETSTETEKVDEMQSAADDNKTNDSAVDIKTEIEKVEEVQSPLDDKKSSDSIEIKPKVEEIQDVQSTLDDKEKSDLTTEIEIKTETEHFVRVEPYKTDIKPEEPNEETKMNEPSSKLTEEKILSGKELPVIECNVGSDRAVEVDVEIQKNETFIQNLETLDVHASSEKTVSETKIETYSLKVEDKKEVTENETVSSEIKTKCIYVSEDLNEIEVYKSEEDIKEVRLEPEKSTISEIDKGKDTIKSDVEVYSYKVPDVEDIDKPQDAASNILKHKDTNDNQQQQKQEKEEEKVTEIKHVEQEVKPLDDSSKENEIDVQEQNKEVHNETPDSKLEEQIVKISESANEKNDKPHGVENVKETQHEAEKVAEVHTDNKVDEPQKLEENAERKLPSNHVDNQEQDQTSTIEKKKDPFSEIRTIEDEIKNLKDKVIAFQGTTKDNEYLMLKDMLVRCIIKLDDIIVSDDDVRSERKRVIKFGQDSVEMLQRNAVQAGADSDDDSETETKD